MPWEAEPNFSRRIKDENPWYPAIRSAVYEQVSKNDFCWGAYVLTTAIFLVLFLPVNCMISSFCKVLAGKLAVEEKCDVVEPTNGIA